MQLKSNNNFSLMPNVWMKSRSRTSLSRFNFVYFPIFCPKKSLLYTSTRHIQSPGTLCLRKSEAQ